MTMPFDASADTARQFEASGQGRVDPVNEL
jgi:hypothetical protein